uniref:ATPbinding Cassette (ABC) Superfamily putative n=1 Tax=Albugo laibachii Nc14 TaxID=890382 RepID=F0WPQ2_9STRA|nr:ATPbinding Cassette (ABC) Superfamily putative [Albugo laibachii Nc14]|eukprot:CCA23303.1 ATPbinding Cassette (ABC) Superfamily putative [Albugo laibachii Nc14]
MRESPEENTQPQPEGSKWVDWKHGERHRFFVKQLESALGRALPQVEIRVDHLSIGANMSVRPGTTPELPTLWNIVRQRVLALLCVRRKAYHKHILSDFSGVFRPGMMTLVLGQPGSGKSTLLKYLGGRFETAKNIQLTGAVTYNGVAHGKLRKQMPQFASYVTQRDKHFSTLTVKETFDFAHAFCNANIVKQLESRIRNGTEEENKSAKEILQYIAIHMPELVMNQLGLGNCQDTIIGNAMLRGVSGGERKRVTMGEMQFGFKNVYLMDEMSTGLDSASTFDIVTYQLSLARTMSRTVMIALLQPPPQVFDLFDNVILLNDSYVMYHGPRAEAIEYFEKLGFRVPSHRDPADFLLDLGTPQQRQYEIRDDAPRTPVEFAKLYQESEYYKKIVSDLTAPVSEYLIRVAKEDLASMPEFQQSFKENLFTLMRRQWMLTFRNKAFLRGRFVMVVMMALIYGSAFINLDPAAIQLVMGFLFSGLLFLALGQATQIATHAASREVFYKQRDANFYRTSAFVLSNSTSQFPLALVESIVFGTIFYWMGGLFASARDFILFLLIIFLANMAFAAWFFFLAMAAPNLSIAKPLSMVSILVFILFAGFVILRNSMPDYLIWLYWLNPIAWALRGLAVLQYSDSSFRVCVYGGVDYCSLSGRNFSEYSLELFDVPKETFWIHWAIIFLIAVYCGFMWFSWVCLEYVRVPDPINIRVEDEEKEQVELDVYHEAQTPVSRPNGSTGHTSGFSSEKHFIPVSLVFRDLWYSVPNPKEPKESLDLLKEVSGFALPGSMTALMGSSGAGKTTLMDVIAGRKTGGQVKGEILLNGHAATDLAIRRATGYCEQMDIHSEASTFREALTFSSMLRQDASIPRQKKLDSVAEALDLLNLNAIADQIIRGSSMEQMKRLTIGVELAAQPSVLFLDEPTSGLDARSAKLIMDGVRKVANSGRTVVCTIHQPSYEVFSTFDNLLLLKRGGETVYFGPLGESCCELIGYFEAIPGIPPITEGYNPATWMLECIGAGVGHDIQNQSGIVEAYKSSELKNGMDAELEKRRRYVRQEKIYSILVTKHRHNGRSVYM